MADPKPPCTDFIVAAIRTLRYKPRRSAKKPEPIGCEGVEINKIFAVALEAYTSTEFRANLHVLIKRKIITVVARVSYAITTEDKTSSYGPTYTELLDSVPAGAETKRYWDVDAAGTVIPQIESRDGARRFREVTLYVTEDVLPERIQKLLDPAVRKSARDIIASMR